MSFFGGPEHVAGSKIPAFELEFAELAGGLSRFDFGGDFEGESWIFIVSWGFIVGGFAVLELEL